MGMNLFAVVQAKLVAPSTHLIDKTREHVVTSIDILIDHFIVNKAVAAIVKEEVCCDTICDTICVVHSPHTVTVHVAVNVSMHRIASFISRLLVACPAQVPGAEILTRTTGLYGACAGDKDAGDSDTGTALIYSAHAQAERTIPLHIPTCKFACQWQTNKPYSSLST